MIVEVIDDLVYLSMITAAEERLLGGEESCQVVEGNFLGLEEASPEAEVQNSAEASKSSEVAVGSSEEAHPCVVAVHESWEEVLPSWAHWGAGSWGVPMSSLPRLRLCRSKLPWPRLIPPPNPQVVEELQGRWG